MSTDRSAEESNEADMQSYHLLLRRMIRILLCVGFCALPFALIFPEASFVRAFVLGLGIGLLNLKMMGRSVERMASGEVGEASRHTVKYFFVRYLIIALGVIIVIRLGTAAVITFAAGLLLPHAGLAITGMMKGREEKRTLMGSG